jgi:zinc protease
MHYSIKIRRLLAGLVTLLTLIFSSCSFLPTQGDYFIESTFGVPKLYLWQNKNSDSNNEVTLKLVVRIGSLQETDSQLGYAHFVEHMAFNGSAKFPDGALQARLKELGLSIGAHSNAVTTFDRTVYTLQLKSADTDKLAGAVEILSEWVSAIEFSKIGIEQEKDVLLQELGRAADAETVTAQAFQGRYAGTQQLNRKPIGTAESIQNATPALLTAFYKKWYVADNMAIIIAGDINTDVTQGIFDQYFKPNSTSTYIEPTAYPINFSNSANYLLFSDKFTQTNSVGLNFITAIEPISQTEDYLPMLAWQAGLDIWLDRVDESAHRQNLEFSAGYDWEHPDTTQRIVTLRADVPDDKFQQVISLLETERLSLIRNGISQFELDQLRTAWLEYEQAQQDSADHLANQLELLFLDGWPVRGQKKWLKALKRELPNLTTDDVQNAFKQVTDTQHRIRILTKPAAAAPSEVQVREWLTTVSLATAVVPNQGDELPQLDLEIAPKPSYGVSSKKEYDNEVTEWSLGNGMTIRHRYDNNYEGVEFNLAGLGGLAAVSPAETPSARHATTVLNRAGLRNLDAFELRQWLNENDMSIIPRYTLSSRGLYGYSPSERAMDWLRLLHIALTEGRFPAATVQAVQEESQVYLTDLAQHPHSAWIQTLDSTLHQNDIALRTLTLDEVQAMSAESLASVYNKHLAGAQNYTLAIVGDISAKEVERGIFAAFDTLPRTQPAQSQESQESQESPMARILAEQSQSMVHRGDNKGGQQAQVTLRFQLPRGAIQVAQNEWHPLLNNWLSEALFQNLREELGLVYAINNWLKADSLDWPVYSLVIASDVAPEQVEDYVAAVQSLLDALIQQPPNSATIQGWMQTIHADSANFIESTENQALLLARAEEFERPVSDVIKPFDPETTLTGQDLADLLAQFRNDPAILVQYIWLP